MTPRRPFPDTLLGHLPALRRLAVALVGSADADDLVQDAAHSALRRPQSGASGSLAALARIVRARAVDRRRREGVRRSESLDSDDTRAGALAERGVGDPAAVAERIERHAALLDALRRLPEPMREVLVLRHFDDLAPAAIAARLGLPASTVRTWLWRGHAHLRAALEREHGPGAQGWLAFLMPVLAPREAGGALAAVAASGIASFTVLAMWKLLALAAVVVASSFLVLRRSPSNELSPARLEAERTAAADLEAPQVAAVDALQKGRVASGEPPPRLDQDAASSHRASGSELNVAASPAAPRLRGRVVLLDGSPGGAGVEVRVRTSGSSTALDSAQTVDDGSFALDVALNRAYEVTALPFAQHAEPLWQPIVATEEELVLRIDALAITLKSASIEAEALHLSVTSFGQKGARSKTKAWMGTPKGDLIVAAGPGYLFSQEGRDSRLFGLLGEGAPSGRYDAELSTQPSGTLGSIALNVVGPTDLDLALIGAFTKPIELDRGLPSHVYFERPPLKTFGRARRIGRGVLAGRYAIEPYYSGPPSAHAPFRPREPRIEIEVTAGRITEVDVEFVPCAGVNVLVHDGSGVVDVERRFQVERFDPALGEWREISFSRHLDDGGWSMMDHAVLGARCFSDPLPSGAARLRALEGGVQLFEDEITLPTEGYFELHHLLVP